MKIVPAILAKNKAEFKKEWQKIAPFFHYVQIDIMDGQFVSNKNNIPAKDIKEITAQHDLEIHLMVQDIPKYITAWENLANVKKIIWHYEAVQDKEALLCLNDYLK